MIDISAVPAMYVSWRQRAEEREARHRVIDAAVKGDFDVFDPDEEDVSNRSPNLIQVALEDTAEAASLVPTLRTQPTEPGEDTKALAAQMERIGWSYLDANNIDLLIPRTVMDLAAYGMHAWTVTPDMEQRIPLIERRDPRQCFPELGWRPGDTVRRAFFARSVFLGQLPEAHQDILLAANGQERSLNVWDDNTSVVLVEYYSEDEFLLAGLVSTENSALVLASSGPVEAAFFPVELERIPNPTGVCPVVIDYRMSLDGQPRGQFDQVVDMLEAHIRLMGLVLDYADQAVYSDVWVRDLIGEMPYGGGAFIELGPNGAIGRVPPAVSALNVQGDLEALIDGIHVGGRWPKSRPGQVDQAIASAKFVEATAGVMNTAIRTYHQTLQRSIQRALRVAFLIDKHMFSGKAKLASGVLRNQEFLLEYDPSVIDTTRVRVRVEYGLGLGRDPANSAVLHIQYGQGEYISKEFVQENIEGLTDVSREQARIDVEKFRGMVLAKLLQGIEGGMVPDSALVEIARAREDGDTLFDIFEKYVVKPAEEAQQAMVPTGLGAPVSPGGPLGPGGPPGGPEGGLMPPAAPPGMDLMARMNVPAGPGGTLGAQVIGGQGGR